jgi:hypothetical protein
MFWEYRGGRIDFERDRDFVLRRVLTHGGWRETRLLRSRLGDAAIRSFLLDKGPRGLDPQRIRFWELVLRLPPRTADAWVEAARAGTWERRRRS